MLFYFDDGQPSKYPTTLDEAIEYKSKLYNDGEKCPSCNYSIKYVKNSKCKYCCRKDAVTFYNFHNGYNPVWTDEDGTHYSQPEAKATPLIITPEQWDEMTELSNVINAESGHSVTPEPCAAAGHVGAKRYGKCLGCIKDKAKPTARQQAIMDGERWYTPDTICPRCDQIAQKRVDNGQCRGCTGNTGDTDRRETPDSAMMRNEPDMVISRQESIEYGFKVYRTGKPCKNNHTGWRYVSTNNCINCLRGK